MTIHDPIAAISTPYGRGGIAVIRLSGDGVIRLAEQFFHTASKKPLTSLAGGQAVYGYILREGKRIDDGIATVFRAPHSYTGEDTVEISCHGGIVLSATVLTCALAAGCRSAEAGEFTKRAFLNGKLSLSQAEAVIGLIDAMSEEQMRLSAAMTRGILHDRIEQLSERLADLIASVYAYIDYPDEDLTDYTPVELMTSCRALLSDVESLAATYRTGHAVSEGIPTVIIGKPNTGKSSLLNRILGRERAIVTDVAGTTRDTVEETVSFGGITLRLADTAGLRQTTDAVEQIGVSKAKEKLEEAELVLAVFDGSMPLDSEDEAVLQALAENSSAEIIPILNKSDRGSCPTANHFSSEPICLSALTGEGMDALAKRVADLYRADKIDYDVTPIVANARQFSAAKAACEHLRLALDALNGGFTQDIAGMDLELALGKLRELDGCGTSEEITDRIFHRFCVGK
ncbi:MAG: tRNA uridine-5-carboxymethylaminomethyl(34) synthesis GTPase MnmE [Ruminococcaceae bacterium]|nr:tRNA uridine-5-carboxymethylaminomethyl(34) synthesis GTPase MnmE [Oscillospiraceae bacterium]